MPSSIQFFLTLRQTLFGMNLFLFDQPTKKLIIADDFWIYVVTWLLLTLVTFLGYQVMARLHKPHAEGGWHRHRNKKSKSQAHDSAFC